MTRKPPTGVGKALFRAPISLYHVGLGGLLGERMILLHHVGRRSGLAREVVLEVVRHDAMTDSFIICSGFGEQAQWFRNVMDRPDVTITSKRRIIDVRAVRLPPDVAAKELEAYGERHPRAAKRLMSYLDLDPDHEKATGYAAASRSLPVLHLTPR